MCARDGTLGEAAGRVPTAMMMRSASSVVSVCDLDAQLLGTGEAGDCRG